MAALGGAFVIYKKKSKYQIYEAFLIHEKGVPLAHVSHQDSSELEDVVVSGMFTAVQDFINDAFSDESSDDNWELDEMKFGEHKIMIERTKLLYLAVIFEGYGPKVRSKVKRTLDEINEEYGKVLKDWDGDLAQIAGIRAMTMTLIGEKTGKGIKKSNVKVPPQIEEKEENESELVDSEKTEIAPWEKGFDGVIENIQEEKGFPKDEEIDDLTEDRQKTDFEDGHPEETYTEDAPHEGTSEGDEGVEIEIYECPVCGKEISSEDTECPRCGVSFH
jgi:rubrerythrin